jgi:hypothetical protein
MAGSWSVALALVGLVVSSSGTQAAEWEWDLIPYLWATGAGLDVDLNNDQVLGGDASFTDLVDKLDLAAMIHFEGRTGRVGFFVDAMYVSLEDSTTRPPNLPLLPNGTSVDAELTLGRYEGAGYYRFEVGSADIDLLLGLRLVDLDQQVDITRTPPPAGSTSASVSDPLLDGFLGGRFHMPFAKRFWFDLRGDVGFGETKSSWTANAGVGMWFGQKQKYGLELAYEHFEIEAEKAGNLGNVDSKVQLTGPLVGFVFRF